MAISHVGVSFGPEDGAAGVRATLDFLLSACFEGLVLTTPDFDSEAMLCGAWAPLPVVTLSGRPLSMADSAVRDWRAAGVGATRYRVDLGHRRVLHLAGPGDSHEAFQRASGYHEVLPAAGLPPRCRWCPGTGRRRPATPPA